MTDDKPKRAYYWDSCIFLAYINEETERVQIIDALLSEISNTDSKIYTSTISVIEVSHSSEEKRLRTLSLETISAIDEFWFKTPTIELVDVSSFIVSQARDLVRKNLEGGLVLKPRDAIHIATAVWINDKITPIDEFHTYDLQLGKLSGHSLTVSEPNILQSRFGNM